ncbi:MAG: beta-ketoacyl-ACP synthase II [Alphaproteobacteria bacterium]|nr:beta-ketoacyl-ACP synthase II [Alphaproteobacteria bacterium]
MRRVVVTGMGLITPFGRGVNINWNSIIESKSGISKITKFDASNLAVRIAGQVPIGKDNPDLFDPDMFLSPKEQKRIDPFILYGIGAGIDAIEDSGWKPESDEDQERTGVIIGSGIGGLSTIAENAILLKEKGPKRISPFFIPASLINLISGHLSIKYGLRGPNHSVVTACATSTHAIGDAARMIIHDDADVMIAGGAEAAVHPLGITGFARAKAVTASHNDSPETGSRPWDKDRDGFVMSEGSAVVVLEEYEHAKKRGAKIYAEFDGYGLSGDGYHITAPAPDGNGGFRAMKMALKHSKTNIENIDYVNAHGTSTPLGDQIEHDAVKRLFGDHASKICMSSTKSSIGHLLGAAGAVEAIFSILAMNNGIVPPTLNLDNPSEGCDIDLVPHVAKERKIKAIMSNSFGFGGTNASLIFKAAP